MNLTTKVNEILLLTLLLQKKKKNCSFATKKLYKITQAKKNWKYWNVLWFTEGQVTKTNTEL